MRVYNYTCCLKELVSIPFAAPPQSVYWMFWVPYSYKGDKDTTNRGGALPKTERERDTTSKCCVLSVAKKIVVNVFGLFFGVRL